MYWGAWGGEGKGEGEVAMGSMGRKGKGGGGSGEHRRRGKGGGGSGEHGEEIERGRWLSSGRQGLVHDISRTVSAVLRGHQGCCVQRVLCPGVCICTF